MSSLAYDVVTVGGGLGASAFAASMAKQGVRVLILEKEPEFKDRVRGEYMCPWGVAEAKKLGVDAALKNTCATELPFVDMGFGPRNLPETTPQHLASISFFHPEMQETLPGGSRERWCRGAPRCKRDEHSAWREPFSARRQQWA